MITGKVYDVTRPVRNGMTVWPGDPQVSIERMCSINDGSPANVSEIRMGVHSGTHMDAPLHFLNDGGDILSLSLDRLFGEVLVIEARQDEIDESILEGQPLNEISAVFFKTRSSDRDEMAPFMERFPAVTEGCARALVQKGIKVVGTDYLSVEYCTDNRFPVHRHLLKNQIAIVENLYLKDVEPGRYSFVCLPLKLEGSDGAPCRVLLFSE